MAVYKNVTSSSITSLLTRGDNVRVNSISLCNNAAVTVAAQLFLSDGVNNYFLIKDVDIPTEVTLVLDHNSVKFNNSSSGLSLFIKLTPASSTANVSVIIN
jgi:hypothetical protein